MFIKVTIFLLIPSIVFCKLKPNILIKKVSSSNETDSLVTYFDVIALIGSNADTPLRIEDFVLTTLCHIKFLNGSFEWQVWLTSRGLDSLDIIKTSIPNSKDSEIEYEIKYHYGGKLEKIFDCEYSVGGYIGIFYVLKEENSKKNYIILKAYWRVVGESRENLNTTKEEDFKFFYSECHEKFKDLIISFGWISVLILGMISIIIFCFDDNLE
jgi:hypothetical protein